MSYTQDLQSLGALPICIAVDKSGSTFSRTLKIEIGVVEEICRLRRQNNNHPVRLLPWCDEVLNPINLPDDSVAMKSLVGNGGTDPSVLFSSEACLNGQIQDSLVENFAQKLAELGLHNKPCVIIVFDDLASGPPSKCHISVGIATYAVVPNCMFLFHDRDTGIVRIMQAKGSFQPLLPGLDQHYLQPVITKFSTWAELPRISYEDLSRVQFSPVKPLGRDEVALQNGLVVKLADILSGKGDSAAVEKIVEDDDNLKSIILASMTRGTGKDLEAWLRAQEKPLPEISRRRIDIDGKAQAAVAQLLEALRNKIDDLQLEELRAILRTAHRDNSTLFRETRVHENDKYFKLRKRNKKMRDGLYMWDWKREKPYWGADDMCVDMDKPDKLDEDLGRKYDDSNKTDPVFLPGFQRRDPVSELTGRCMLCHNDAVLAILLKVPPNIATKEFPAVGTYTKLVFPLAMGSFAEVDILSFFVCCDSCAFYLEQNSTCPYGDSITKPLCLVCIKDNQPAWLEALDTALKGRFDIPGLISVCIAILDRKLVENNVRDAPEEDKELFQLCAQWTIRNLAQIAEAPVTLSSQFGNGDGKTPLKSLDCILSAPNFIDPGHPENVDLFLLRYPVAGSMVLLRLLQAQGLAQQRIQTLLFQQVLFHIMEQYFVLRASNTQIFSTEDILGHDLLPHWTNSPSQSSSVPVGNNDSQSIPVAQLAKHNLINSESWANFRTMVEFNDVEN